MAFASRHIEYWDAWSLCDPRTSAPETTPQGVTVEFADLKPSHRRDVLGHINSCRKCWLTIELLCKRDLGVSLPAGMRATVPDRR